MDAILAQRFAPLNFLAIPSFPNPSPSFADYADLLPIFCGDVGDNPAQHLIQFHWFIDRLKIYHEYALMKLFVYSLNGDAQKWYRSLSTAGISSLQDFHAAFLRYCGRFYLSEVLLEGCCDKFKSHIHPTSDLATRKKSSDAFGERDSKMENICSNVKTEQSPCLSDSREEGFPDYTDNIVPSYVSRDPLGPLLNMTIAPDLRDDFFAAEDHSNSLSDLSRNLFPPMGTKKHAQIACLLLQQTTDLGSTFFDDGPDDVE